MNNFWNEKMKDFLSNVGVFFLKGIFLFLSFALFFVIISYFGILDYDTYIYPIIMSVSFEVRLLILMIVGVVAHYTFWNT
jgi:hypothetical protein